MDTHSAKDISEIPERVDLIQFAAGHKAVNDGGSPDLDSAAGKQVIFV